MKAWKQRPRIRRSLRKARSYREVKWQRFTESTSQLYVLRSVWCWKKPTPALKLSPKPTKKFSLKKKNWVLRLKRCEIWGGRAQEKRWCKEQKQKSLTKIGLKRRRKVISASGGCRKIDCWWNFEGLRWGFFLYFCVDLSKGSLTQGLI